MTPELKAKELIEKFMDNPFTGSINKDHAKACVLVCVEEILKAKHECGCEQSVVIDGKYETYITYWLQVKQQLSK